jgi:damage-control phosphatase, subfamily III
VLLNAIADPQTFYSTPSEDEKHTGKTPTPLSEKEVDELSFLFQQWNSFNQEGQLVLRPNRFWTESGSYWHLPTSDPRLFEVAAALNLAINLGFATLLTLWLLPLLGPP